MVKILNRILGYKKLMLGVDGSGSTKSSQKLNQISADVWGRISEYLSLKDLSKILYLSLVIYRNISINYDFSGIYKLPPIHYLYYRECCSINFFGKIPKGAIFNSRKLTLLSKNNIKKPLSNKPAILKLDDNNYRLFSALKEVNPKVDFKIYQSFRIIKDWPIRFIKSAYRLGINDSQIFLIKKLWDIAKVFLDNKVCCVFGLLYMSLLYLLYSSENFACLVHQPNYPIHGSVFHNLG